MEEDICFPVAISSCLRKRVFLISINLIDTRGIRLGDHRALCDAARLSLPNSGPAVRLFRGAGAFERRRGIYGPSRSADAAAAERFALGRRVMDGGSVLLETLAPRAAIISAIDYPPPPTYDEIHDLKRECLDLVNDELVIDEFHDEREYVVDRRYLNAVTLVRRYEQIHFADAPPISTAAVSQTLRDGQLVCD